MPRERRPTRPAGYAPARCGKCRRQIVRLVPIAQVDDRTHRCLDCRQSEPVTNNRHPRED